MAKTQTRLSGHAARLRRNNHDTDQNNQQQSGGAVIGNTRPTEEHQAAYLQGYYSDKMTTPAVTCPGDALSPSSNSSSTPRKLLQNRRQNMMQRRIEMRQKSEESQRQQQQRSRSSERLSAHSHQNQMQNDYLHQSCHMSPQTQNQPNVQRQVQHIAQSQFRGAYPNNLSLLKGHNGSQHVQQISGQQRNNDPQHPANRYPISPPNERRPPSHPNSSTSSQRQRQNFYPRTQPRQNTSKQQSPAVLSPPVFDRKQNMMREYPSTNLFNGGIQLKSPGQFRDDYGEGFEVEAQQFMNISFNQGSSGRSQSPYESPSDEILVEDGYYEDEIQQQQYDHVQTQQQRQQHQQWQEKAGRVSNQLQQQHTRQQRDHPSDQMRHHQAPMDELIQNQPDWHQLNQNRLYQKKFAVRYQNAATNSSPKFQSQAFEGSQIRSSPTKQPNISNFSPIESLSNRTDQIQRKQRQPSQGRGYQVTEYSDVIENEYSHHQNQADEDILDRARSFETSYARKYSNSSEQRSKSVPRERSSQWPSVNNSNHSHHASSHVLDDDTVTESVASRKKEWEKKFQPVQHQPKKVRQLPENEAFGVWSERANRLAQQRLHEQRNEQRKQLDEQRKSIEEKWRRSAAKSMSPERRQVRREEQPNYYVPVYSESMEYRDEYQSSGQQHSGRHADQHSIEQDSTHMSIEDRRRMLWDGKERLRAVLPKASSFDSANRPPDYGSPGTASDSQGSLFKSKFIHAAAVATQSKANIEGDENITQRSSPKSHLKAGAVSSHYTDSTAGTTPVGSNGSSNRTPSTNVSRAANHTTSRTGQPQGKTRAGAGAGERSQTNNKVSVMPPIAEAPRSSVADLIARINAVSRSNPTEALAAIDSILKAESGVSSSQNIYQQKPVKQAQSTFSPSRPSADKQVPPLGKDFFRSKYEDVVRETGKNEKEEDEEEDDSYLSSEDSTVSSMTNPTYQSIPVQNRSSSGQKKEPEFSPPVLEEFEVKPSKSSRMNSMPPQPRIQSTAQANPRPYSNVQRQGDVIVSKPPSDLPEDTSNRKFVETIAGGLNYRLEKSKSEEESKRTSPTNSQGQTTYKSMPTASAKSRHLDSAWEPVPQNDFFQASKSNAAKSKDAQKPRVSDSKSSKESQSKRQNDRKNESKYLSDTELSQGQTTGLPSVVSDAFSGIDIDLDNEPASNSIQNQSQHKVASSRVFSTVDVDLEPTKTVRQRRQELEYLAKNWNEKSPRDDAEPLAPSPTEKQLNSHGSCSKIASSYDWATTPEEEKKKVKAEPALRLKGSKKLAQKFASLVKAFESDGY
jgi:hypothetical protein